jgi:hypothetical protein
MDAQLAETKTGSQLTQGFPYWDFATVKSSSPYPDYAPGTLYVQDAWATVDGWDPTHAVTIAPLNGALRVTATASDPYVQRTFSSSIHGLTVVVRLRKVSGSFSTQDTAGAFIANPGYTHLLSVSSFCGFNAFVSALPVGQWGTFTFQVPTTYTDLTLIRFDLYQDSDLVWDLDYIYIGDGTYTYNVPIIYDDRQDQQQAAVSAFTNLASIPQIPEAGVDWTGAMTGDTTFGEIDSQINTAIGNCGLNYYPKYTILNGGLKVTVNKAGT